MVKRIDFFKLQTGRKLSELAKPEPLENIVQRRIKQVKSRYDARTLGVGAAGSLYLTEEEREVNMHIVGAPGEGKSKFLEYHIRKDIDMGNGLCLLDPSDSGDTAKKILRYCARKNHKKVCYISTDTLVKYGKIACLKPLKSRHLKQSVDGLMETVGILFGTKESETPRIKRRLSALLRILGRKNATVYETKYFAEYNDPHKWDFLDNDHDSRVILQDYRTQNAWETFMSSTINRLNDFWQEPLSLMLGADTGVDFVKMIREGWTVLVNLFPGQYLTVPESQLLGVLIVSQLNQAIDILTDDALSNRWKSVFYLYIDEAGRFATPQIDQILSYKRKSGLRLILAHHYFSQFENRKVLDSVKQSTGIKVMFNTREPGDRLEMMKSLGYGGDIPAEVAAYANKDLPKQYAIIKKNKEAPARVRIPDTPDVSVPKEKLERYIESLLEEDWYLTREQIEAQISSRIKPKDEPVQSAQSSRKQNTNSKASRTRTVSDGNTDGDSAPPRRKSMFDDE